MSMSPPTLSKRALNFDKARAHELYSRVKDTVAAVRAANLCDGGAAAAAVPSNFYCPCGCGLPDGPLFPLFCPEYELSDLGFGVPMFFYFQRFLIMLLALYTFTIGAVLYVYNVYAGVNNPLAVVKWTVTSDDGRTTSPLWIWLGTEGNHGPRGDNSFLSPALGLTALLVTWVITSAFRRQQRVTAEALDIGTVSPHDFSVLVRGLPNDATKESEAIEFAETSLNLCREVGMLERRPYLIVGGPPSTLRKNRVVRCIVAFRILEVVQLLKKYKKTLGILHSYKEDQNVGNIADTLFEEDSDGMLAPRDVLATDFLTTTRNKDSHNNVTNPLRRQAVQCQKKAKRLAGEIDLWLRQIETKGTGFLIQFRSEADAKDFVKIFKPRFVDRFKWFLSCWCCGPERFPETPNALRIAMRRPPLFRNRFFPLVEKAPDPSDIIWEALSVIGYNLLFRRLAGFLLTGSLLAGSFFIVWQLSMFKQEQRDDNTKSLSSSATSLLVGLVIIVINAVMPAFMHLLVNLERPSSQSAFESSLVWRLTLVQCLNTAIIVLLVHSPSLSLYQQKEINAVQGMWFVKGGLIQSVLFTLLSNAFIAPALTFVPYLTKRLQRAAVSCCPPIKKRLTQDNLESLFEGPTIDWPARYAGTLKTLFVTILYLPICPLSAPIGFFGITLEYIVSRYFLLRLCRRPNFQSAKLPLQAAKILTIILTFHPLLIFRLTQPSLSLKQHNLWRYISLLLTAAFIVLSMFFPSRLLDRLLLGFFSKLLPKMASPNTTRDAEDISTNFDDESQQPIETNIDFFEAQYYFVYRYHRNNPIYHLLPEHSNPIFIDDTISKKNIQEEVFGLPNGREVAPFFASQSATANTTAQPPQAVTTTLKAALSLLSGNRLTTKVSPEQEETEEQDAIDETGPTAAIASQLVDGLAEPDKKLNFNTVFVQGRRATVVKRRSDEEGHTFSAVRATPIHQIATSQVDVWRRHSTRLSQLL